MSTQTTTSEHMLLIRGTHWRKGLSPEEVENAMSRWTAWFDRLTQQGKAYLDKIDAEIDEIFRDEVQHLSATVIRRSTR